jgi:hypothetical protein
MVSKHLTVEERLVTDTVTTRTPSHSSESLLRLAIRADATVCAGLGLLIAMAADPLSRLSGLSASSEWIAGAALVVYGVALYVMAAAPFVRRIGVGLGIGVVVVNVAFAVAAAALLATGLLPLTGAGEAMMLATVAATLGVAYVQYLGVRRLA